MPYSNNTGGDEASEEIGIAVAATCAVPVRLPRATATLIPTLTDKAMSKIIERTKLTVFTTEGTAVYKHPIRGV